MDNANFALLYPTLVIGMGGTGARSTRLLKRMVERYFRSPARAALQPDPSCLLDEIETTLLEPVVERL